MIELVNRFGIIPGIKKKYLIDSPEELTELDATFGNEAYCIGDTKTYICNGSGEYVEKKVSGDGGKKLYQHCIYIDTIGHGGNPFNLTLMIMNNNAIQMTYENICSFLSDNGFTTSDNLYPSTGWSNGSTNDSSNIIGLFSRDNLIMVKKKYMLSDGIPSTSSANISSDAPIIDTIIEL